MRTGSRSCRSSEKKSKGGFNPSWLIPFGGIAGTALDAMLMGCHWFGCELESKANGGSPFVELGNENIGKWSALGMPGTAVLVQGDSRRLVENLSGVMAQCVVSSPPYADGLAGGGQ